MTRLVPLHNVAFLGKLPTIIGPLHREPPQKETPLLGTVKFPQALTTTVLRSGRSASASAAEADIGIAQGREIPEDTGF